MGNRRGKKLALAAACGVVALVLIAVGFFREDILAWYRAQQIGYWVTWMPERVVPRGHLNSSGQVGVTVRTGALQSGDHRQRRDRAGRWSLSTQEVVSLMAPPLDELRSRVSSINEHGHVVGSVDKGFYLGRSFLWTEAGGTQVLPTLGGQQTAAIDVNSKDQVVGWSHPPGRGNPWQAFVWDVEAGIKDLGALLGGGESQAVAINESGWVVGNASLGRGPMEPFLWKPKSGMRKLGWPPGSRNGNARDINDRGQVLVNCTRAGRSTGNSVPILGTPFLWTEKKGYAPLPVPSGYDDVRGVAVNDQGVILLSASNRSTGDVAGYLVRDGELKKLPDLLEGGLTYYWDINDTGWLVGAIEPRGNEGKPVTRGFIAQPVR